MQKWFVVSLKFLINNLQSEETYQRATHSCLISKDWECHVHSLAGGIECPGTDVNNKKCYVYLFSEDVY